MSCVTNLLADNNLFEFFINSLNSELSVIIRELVIRKKNELVEAEKRLAKQIEAAKWEITQIEYRNSKLTATKSEMKTEQEQIQTLSSNAKPLKLEKEQKQQNDKLTPCVATFDSQKDGAESASSFNAGRLDFRVGKILEISKHPNDNNLYLGKIDCGEPNPRTIVSGLIKFVPIEEMRDRMVIVLCNLKTTKIRGIQSEGRVMCASTPEKVEVLTPPPGSMPGDLVCCEGHSRNPDVQLIMKKNILKACAANFRTNDDLIACFKDSALYVHGKGKVVAKTLKNAPVK